MAQSFAKGGKEKWNLGPGTGTGGTARRCTSRVRRTSEGAEIARNATDDGLAYLVQQEDGSEVPKSGSELGRA